MVVTALHSAAHTARTIATTGLVYPKRRGSSRISALSPPGQRRCDRRNDVPAHVPERDRCRESRRPGSAREPADLSIAGEEHPFAQRLVRCRGAEHDAAKSPGDVAAPGVEPRDELLAGVTALGEAHRVLDEVARLLRDRLFRELATHRRQTGFDARRLEGLRVTGGHVQRGQSGRLGPDRAGRSRRNRARRPGRRRPSVARAPPRPRWRASSPTRTPARARPADEPGPRTMTHPRAPSSSSAFTRRRKRRSRSKRASPQPLSVSSRTTSSASTVARQ